jgi:hypothetical protein
MKNNFREYFRSGGVLQRLNIEALRSNVEAKRLKQYFMR